MSLLGLALVSVAPILSDGRDATTARAFATERSMVDSITLTYMCSTTFRVRNASHKALTVIWKVVGTPEEGVLDLPRRPAKGASSEVTFTTLAAGTVQLLRNKKVIQTAANEGRSCSTGRVPAAPPDSLPSWYNERTGITAGLFTRNIVVMGYKDGASPAERQAAIDSIGGQVVGGFPDEDNGDGLYLVFLPDDGSGASLRQAVDRLSRMPQVDYADLDYRIVEPN